MLCQFGFPYKFIGWIMECVTTTSFSLLINGELKGIFKGRRSLRQGDLLSPYLFTLCMEIFSRMMEEAVKGNSFSFHPNCKHLKLTHLMFADDLLLFSKGDAISLKIMYDVLNDFATMSGLHMNVEKSLAYFGGFTNVEKNDALNLLGMKEGSLPFKYLGVPLSSKKLNVFDYRPLIDRITSCITSWTSKLLSFAGRLELIQTVIYSIINYWSSIFVFPKVVVREIEMICRKFLWQGGLEGKRKNPIKWSNVCKPNVCGGLGLLDLVIINLSLMMKIFWDLAHKRDTLWVKWIHSRYIKEGDVWNLEVKKHYSWSFRSIIHLRSKAIQCVHPDSRQWIGVGRPFSSKSMYMVFAKEHPKEWWAYILWNKLIQRKCVFIAWFAIQNRLYTRDRLKEWRIIEDATCLLCGIEDESVEHLFFYCQFSRQVWSHVCDFNGWVLPSSWNLLWSREIRKWKRDVVSLAKMASMCTSIYYIWRARNDLLYHVRKNSPYQVARSIIFDLKIRFSDINMVPKRCKILKWCNRIGICPKVVTKVVR